MKEEQAREAAWQSTYQSAEYETNNCCDCFEKGVGIGFDSAWNAGVEYANRWAYLPELPQKDGWFAVTINDGDGFPDLVEPFWWNGSQWTDGDNIGDSTIRNEQTVVAWRELPEPADIR